MEAENLLILRVTGAEPRHFDPLRRFERSSGAVGQSPRTRE
jgi:hypothetical protein